LLVDEDGQLWEAQNSRESSNFAHMLTRKRSLGLQRLTQRLSDGAKEDRLDNETRGNPESYMDYITGN